MSEARNHNGRKVALEAFEREYWDGLLRKHAGRVVEVAKEAGVHRSGVYTHIKRLGISPPTLCEPV